MELLDGVEPDDSIEALFMLTFLSYLHGQKKVFSFWGQYMVNKLLDEKIFQFLISYLDFYHDSVICFVCVDDDIFLGWCAWFICFRKWVFAVIIKITWLMI